MKKGESKKTYWVMYSERCQRNVAAWNEPRNVQWVIRETQHFGTAELETAEKSVVELQKHVDNKTHFLESHLSGPDMHHLCEAWIEVEFRTRLVPNHPELVDAAFKSLLGANEANPAAENSKEA